MIGLDTNVLIRYLVQDDEAQAETANHFIESKCSEECPGFINHIVLCEVCWVLATAYKQKRSDIANVIACLLQVRQLEIQEASVVWRALSDFRDSNADFSDHLIAHSNQLRGCVATVTFDKKAAKLLPMRNVADML
ncbi:hypothetical protein AB833_15450 [Chromatiales bacterium (ex Bugula neritina AB1)]|nr:hypothetical protein AB833_15450 [Chromatiales bacterium (ex Bugula neritina AB1)]